MEDASRPRTNALTPGLAQVDADRATLTRVNPSGERKVFVVISRIYLMSTRPILQAFTAGMVLLGLLGIVASYVPAVPFFWTGGGTVRRGWPPQHRSADVC